MQSIRMRARRQLTLPSEVVAAAGLQIDDDLDVSYVNGIIQLTPAKSRRGGAGMSRFLGAAGASYGADTEAMNEYLRQQRESW